MLASAIKDLKSGKDQSQQPRSVIQIKPQVSWPTLGNNDHDIDAFFDEFEEVTGLCNDGKGMKIGITKL